MTSANTGNASATTLTSEYYRKTQLEPEITQQTGQANFNGTKLANTMIPLPPREEQKRIVAKVNQLMALCDELEAKLKKSQTDSDKLMDASCTSGVSGVAKSPKALKYLANKQFF
jgi:restriction endonuclease S subunit